MNKNQQVKVQTRIQRATSAVKKTVKSVVIFGQSVEAMSLLNAELATTKISK